MRRRSTLYFLSIVAGMLAFLALAGPAFADDSLAAKELQVEKQLGCPICTDLPLNVCDNEICQQMRGVIHQKLSEGETPDQVVQYFVDRYGNGVLLTPPQQGFSLAAWYLPLLAVALGAIIVVTFLRHSLRRQRAIERRLAVEDPALERYRERVRKDLGTPEELA
ncbi:MAG TPA: cytochrome c-type biogenesis protein [Chloroflexota bacterium]|nr:cytochrome c-type biogenesis protein [Chloroflexota bacterium]